MRSLRGGILLALLFGGCQPEPFSVSISNPAGPTLVVVGQPLFLTGQAVTQAGDPAWGATLSWQSSLQGTLGTGPFLPVWLKPGVHRITLTGIWDFFTSEAVTTVLVRPPNQDPLSYVAALAGAPLSQANEAQNLILWTYQNLPQFVLGSPPQLPPTMMGWYAAHPTNVNAAIGNGRLTAGVSSRGVITVLRWPTPSHTDHMEYLADNYDAPEMGALPNLGAFAGVRYLTPLGKGFTWLRDPAWTVTQGYWTDEGNAAKTTYQNAALGLTVVQLDFVAPSEDVLVRRFLVTRAPSSPVIDARMVHYQNLAPCTYRIPRVPLTDWLLDLFNDYAVLFHSGDAAILHFRPAQPNFQPLLTFAAAPHANLQAEVDALADSADSVFGSGVYFAVGSDPGPIGFHCGTDLPTTDPDQPNPYDSAISGDASAIPYSFVRGASALERPIEFAPDSDVATFYFAAGGTAGTARSRLAWARAQGADALLAQEESWWSNWVSAATMPATDDPQTLRVCRRSLISIRTAMAESGCVSASIASQLPYSVDWPRDGAFVNLALDLAGYHDLVTKHNLFYASVQRNGPFFGGTYEMNYWADGMPGGPILLEIDNVAMATWTLWNHAAFLADPAAKAAYLAQVYPAIKKGAQFLATWKDPATGLQAPANEDDNPALTQGLQGAVATVLGLKSAIDAANAVGDTPAIPPWTVRLAELKTALLSAFLNPATGAYGLPPPEGGAPGSSLRGATWFLWPAEILPLASSALVPQGNALWQATSPFFAGSPGIHTYNAEHLLALAYLWKTQGVNGNLLTQALTKLTHELPTPGTNHYAETYEVVSGSAAIRNRNDIPHVWQHALVYLAARRILDE